MRNKIIIISLLAVLVIGIAALSYNWFDRAEIAKKDVKDFIATLNTNDSKVTYQSVTANGFPFAMNISVVNPEFSGRVDKILSSIGIDKALKVESFPEWQQDIKLDGSINVGVNILSNKFKIEATGSSTGKTVIAGKQLNIKNENFSGDNYCEIGLKNTGNIASNLWNMYSIIEQKDRLINDFRTFECATSGGKTINSDNKELLFSIGGSKLFISNNKDTDVADLRFLVMMKDAEVTKAYDEIYISYMTLLFPNQKLVLPSAYGKQNIEVDIAYNGAADWTKASSKELPLEISVNKFLFTNAAYQTSSKFSIKTDITGNQRDAKLSYRTEFNGTDLIRILLKEQLTAMIDLIAKSGSTAVRTKLASVPVQDIDKYASSAVPDFKNLGKITVALDASYLGDDNFVSADVKVPSFEISFSPYGLTANANFTRGTSASKSPIPVGNMTIECRNCLTMIDDFVSYFERSKFIFSVFDFGKASSISFPAETVQGFKNFLLAINPEQTPTGNGVFKFVVENKGTEEPTINGRKATEVTEIFKKSMTRNIPAPRTAPIAPTN